MALLRRMAAGVRALARRDRDDQELEHELRAYLDASIEQKIAAGVSPDQAARAARIELGSFAAVKDSVRETGWESRVEAIWYDLRQAARSLRASPAFAAVAVLTLALGIGANTAVFSVVNGLVLRTLPVHEPHRLMLVSSHSADRQGWPAGWPYVIWQQLRAHANEFDGALAWSGVGSPVRFDLAQHGERDLVDGVYVSGSFFSALGVEAILGRTLMEADDVPGGGPDGLVAVISYGLWQRRFGGASDVVGRPITLNRVPFTIAGVAHPGFSGLDVGRAFDVAIPLASVTSIRSDDDWVSSHGPAFVNVVVRLKETQSAASAAALLRGVQAQVFDDAMPAQPEFGTDPYRKEFLDDPFTLAPAGTGISEIRGMYADPLLAMLAVVALVLLIACTNIATLMRARGAARRHEMDVRLALGAPRWRLASHALAEGAVLWVGGALLGLLLAAWSGPALGTRLTAFGSASELRIALDPSVLACTAAVTVSTLLLFGGLPALRAARTRPVPARETLRHTSRASLPRGPLAFQVALTLVLLVAAGLFIRTFERLAYRHPGFDSDRVLVVSVDASDAAIPDAARMSYYQQLLDTVATVPDVAHAAASEFTPVHFGTVRVSAIDIPGLKLEERRPVPTYAVTPGWFATYGLPLREGRDFDHRDTVSGPLVAVVNESLARMLFEGEDPIGRTVPGRFGPATQDVRQITVIGIAGDAILGSLWDVVPPTLYIPLSQQARWGSLPNEISISVRSASGSPSTLARPIGAALGAVDRNLSFSFRALSDAVETTIAWERLMAVVAGIFGGLALALVGVGVYGVTAFVAAQRRAEAGIRIALGATRADIVGRVVRSSLAASLLGIAVGGAAAAGLSRYVERMLFGVTPLDPATFAAAAGLLAAIALAAAVLPAYRAATADPLASLRCD